MLRIALFAYSVLYTLFSLFYLPYYFYRIRFRDRRGVKLSERLGRAPLSAGGSRPTVWIHAVSVGEVNAVKPLVSRLSSTHHVYLSTTTDTGQEQARQLFADAVTSIYFPFDWRWACRRALTRLRPTVVLMAETEIWPGFLASADALKIPVLLVNGRLSDRSFGRYRRLRGFIAPLLGLYREFCMQSLEDKKRMIALGAPPERVHWSGNLKYDYRPAPNGEKDALAKRIEDLIRTSPETEVWLCGSTREKEEAILLAGFKNLRRTREHLRLILAPRHPHRSGKVASLIADYGYRCLKRSQIDEAAAEPPDVLILDSIGELPYLYRIADVVFIGGSLVPRGGQNVIEAAYFGKPILFGPSMENFRDVSKAFTESYAALQVANGAELTDRIEHLLKDPVSARWLGRNARKVMRDNQGALEKTIVVIEKHLGGGGTQAPSSAKRRMGGG